MSKESNQKDKSQFLKDLFQSKVLFIIVWICSFIVVSIIFLYKLDDIKTNLKNTRFFERVFGTTPAFIENHVDKNEKADLGESETVINIDKITGNDDDYYGDLTEVNSENSVWNQKNTNNNVVDSNKSQDSNENINKIIRDTAIPTPEDDSFTNNDFVEISKIEENENIANIEDDVDSINSNIETFKSKLWFITVNEDGRISRKLYIRKIVKSSAPLTNNIKLLLQGPTSEELKTGCMSLIPSGTRLLTAIVKDGVAYLNFSKEFETNRLGSEGYLAQLQQVVFTSTEFATVNSVQILIDGQKRETLGEGVWIGSPLSRVDFR